MGKYDSLKAESSKSIFRGSKLVEQLSDFVVIKDGRAVIQGLPACPECGNLLTHQFLKNEWYCTGCGTGWDEESLVEALQNEREVEGLCKEVRDDRLR